MIRLSKDYYRNVQLNAGPDYECRKTSASLSGANEATTKSLLKDYQSDVASEKGKGRNKGVRKGLNSP